jgi:hypothetical protein
VLANRRFLIAAIVGAVRLFEATALARLIGLALAATLLLLAGLLALPALLLATLALAVAIALLTPAVVILVLPGALAALLMLLVFLLLIVHGNPLLSVFPGISTRMEGGRFRSRAPFRSPRQGLKSPA